MPKTPIVVRNVSESDLEQLQQLWNEQYDYHYEIQPEYYDLSSPVLRQFWIAYLAEELANPETGFLIAEEKDKIIGFLRYRISKEKVYSGAITVRGEIEDVFVRGPVRCKGVGAQLLQQAEENMRANGVQSMKIQCSMNNPKAVRFYERAGYQMMQVLLFKLL